MEQDDSNSNATSPGFTAKDGLINAEVFPLRVPIKVQEYRNKSAIT